jgi:hypothetical protein
MNGLLIVFVVTSGAVCRTILPYLLVLRKNRTIIFNRKYLIPLAASVIIAMITVPMILATLSPLQLIAPLTLVTAIPLFMAGYGFNALSRDLQKFKEGPSDSIRPNDDEIA